MLSHNRVGIVGIALYALGINDEMLGWVYSRRDEGAG